MNWSLIAGPGARIAELKAFLLPEPGDGARVGLADIGQLGELLEIHGGCGKLLLSADEIETEDVGLLRHWLRRERGFELVLCGTDPSRRPVRALIHDAGARWLHWAPDIDDLRGLMRAPASLAERDSAAPSTRAPGERDDEECDELEPLELAPAPRRAPAHASTSGGASSELERIEAILGSPSSPSAAESSSGERAPAARSAPPRTAREDDPYERAAARAARSTPFAPRDTPDAELETRDEVDAQHPSRRVLAPHPRPPAEEIFGRALESPSAPREAPAAPERAPAAPSTPVPPSASAATPPLSERPSPRAPSSPGEGTTLPAPYFRDQVADLADMAQRIELDLAGVRDGVLDSGIDDAALEPALEHLTQDVARLLQFTRTLGYLVAPPPSGSQSFDLGELVELFVSTAPAKGDGPRFLLRKDGPARVTSDRQLLSQALDAFFFVARSSARPGEVVRVHLRLAAEASKATELGIEFPAGPLAGLDPARIVEPYALRRTFPELGANALLAASGIVRGQGGEVELARVGESHLEWRLRLPLADARAPSAPPGVPMNRPPVRADDPFA